jgi:AraC-like DNA-binding protein
MMAPYAFPARALRSSAMKTLAAATVSVQGVWLLAAGAAACGVDVASLLARHGLAEAPGADVDARVPAGAVLALWAELPALTALPHFGVWLAELAGRAPPSSLGAHLVHSAPTLGDGLARLLAFERVIHGVQATTLEVHGGVARFEHRPPIGAGPGVRPAIEFAFAWIVGTARRTLGRDVCALGVSFRHASPGSPAEYARAFGTAPRFQAAGDALELDAALLGSPQVTADELLARLVERHARGLLVEIPADAGATARARGWILGRLAQGDAGSVTLAALALALRTPARTLQRRLAREGTSFATLLDEGRRELALRYLAEPSTSAAEVAFALGFGDQSTFHRAFVRWTGSTPGEHKRRLFAAVAPQVKSS